MDEDYYDDYPEFYGYDEGSDRDNYEDEQVFQDARWTDEDEDEDDEQEPLNPEDYPSYREDFGFFGEAGLWD